MSSRVQGGWASAKNKGQSKVGNFDDQISKAFSAGPVVKYEESAKKPRIKPEDRIIRDAGEHILSDGLKGTSKIVYYPDFFDLTTADHYFATLLHELPWNREQDDFGPHNRLTAWFGEHPYSYTGLTHKANDEWNPLLMEIRQQLEHVTSHTFNSVLCNLYRNNHDGVGWHSDDEPGLKDQPYIASVSLGEIRWFEMRQKPDQPPLDDFTYSQHVKIRLLHGSLLIMQGSTQDYWQHRVPTEYHDRSPRINLTYRTIYPV